MSDKNSPAPKTVEAKSAAAKAGAARPQVPQIGLPDLGAAMPILAGLAQNSHALLRNSAENFGRVPTLPYDHTAVPAAMGQLAASYFFNPLGMAAKQAELVQNWSRLWWNFGTRAMGGKADPVAAPAKADRRFRDASWNEEVPIDYIKQTYLLTGRWLQSIVADSKGLDEPARLQLEFVVQQFIDAVSPTNFATTNPEVVRKTLATGGMNLLKGFGFFLDDLANNNGLIKRRGDHPFEIGKTIAATPGAVVFENELMQLIQYAPTTPDVAKRPLLFVPPLVNKYYLFDLQPKTSFLKWLVDAGYTVFVISWVNPGVQQRDKNSFDYVKEGPLAALDAIRLATGEAQADIVSFCMGGTLVSLLNGYLASKGEGHRVGSTTLIASMTDYTDMGDWSVFLDSKHSAAFEKYLVEKGYVESHDLAKLFSVIRANDLIWSSVISHYLLADDALPSDMLFWFDDGARIPAAMLNHFTAKVIQENRLCQAGGLVIDGVPVDLSKVSSPVYFVSMQADHVSNWEATYRGTRLFGGEVHFLLGGSGHNAGAINPPAAKKHGYWTNSELPGTAQAWLEGATRHEGSWWPEWEFWMKSINDKRVPARVPGAGDLAVIEAAPGSYVLQRH